MAKENPNTKPKAETPFRKFERLTKKLLAVPKERGKEARGDKPQPQA